MRESKEFKEYLKGQYNNCIAKYGSISFSADYTMTDFENDAYKWFDRDVLQPTINARRAVQSLRRDKLIVGRIKRKL
jgi:hypothetical protein